MYDVLAQLRETGKILLRTMYHVLCTDSEIAAGSAARDREDFAMYHVPCIVYRQRKCSWLSCVRQRRKSGGTRRCRRRRRRRNRPRWRRRTNCLKLRPVSTDIWCTCVLIVAGRLFIHIHRHKHYYTSGQNQRSCK